MQFIFTKSKTLNNFTVWKYYFEYRWNIAWWIIGESFAIRFTDLWESVCDFVTVSSRVFWVTWKSDDELLLLTGLRSGLNVADFVTGLVFKNTATAAHSYLCFLPSAWLLSPCTYASMFDNAKDFLHLFWASLLGCAGTSQSLNLSSFNQRSWK